MAKENNLINREEGHRAQEAPVRAPVEIPQNVMNLHNKGLAALERNNPDIAIDIFLRCVQQIPGFIAARRNLRVTAIARFKASGGINSIAHHLAPLTGLLQKIKVKGLLKSGKLEQALYEGEKLLLVDPLELGFADIVAQVAVKAGLVEEAIMTLELVRENLPAGNLKILDKLGRLYFQVKNYRGARNCFEIVQRARPTDAEIRHLLKDSEALATLDSGWTEAADAGDYRKVLANEEETVKLEQEGKVVKTADDADSLIAAAKLKIEAEPNNVNYYLNLTNIFMQQKRYGEAMETIESARKIVGADAELDRRYSNAKIAQFNAEIEELESRGDEAGVIQKTAERDQYVFDDIAERVTRYPNDQHLRYELAMQYFKNDYIDEAIQQFQIAQKNPKDRVVALYHLALCFRKKGLLDLAVSQLEMALEYLPTMNSEKMDVYYMMGEILLEEGKRSEAEKYFKEIYKVDVTYRDVGKHIENIYSQKKKKSIGEGEGEDA